jgi:hypothetical protein
MTGQNHAEIVPAGRKRKPVGHFSPSGPLGLAARLPDCCLTPKGAAAGSPRRSHEVFVLAAQFVPRRAAYIRISPLTMPGYLFY